MKDFTVPFPQLHLFDYDVSVINNRFHGNGVISGNITTMNNQPVQKRVFVFDRSTMQLAGGVWSALDGSWKVDYLDTQRDYTILYLDETKTYEPVSYDWLKAKEVDDV